MYDLFQPSAKAADYKARVERFMAEHIYPNERGAVPDGGDTARPLGAARAPGGVEGEGQGGRASGTCSSPTPSTARASPTSSTPRSAEIMGRLLWAPEVFNVRRPTPGTSRCSPATARRPESALATPPRGEIRSGFAMTEPAVASSDATNIERPSCMTATSTSSTAEMVEPAPATALQIVIFMGKTAPEAPSHNQQSMILVPMNASGVKNERMLTVFG